DNGFDAISMSFACSPLEAFELKKRIQQRVQKGGIRKIPLIFAKLETIFSVSPDDAGRFLTAQRLAQPSVYKKKISTKDISRYKYLIKKYKARPIDALCDVFDGAMVARGDLAVEANKYRVPVYQQQIIQACR